MKVWHDRSYMSAEDEEFISRGYAVDDLFCVRISYEYAGSQKQENRKSAKKMTSAQWNDLCAEAAQCKSDYIFPVMEAISEAFPCYQYDSSSGLQYESPAWELFFWCNDLSTTTQGKITGRDYSYITLSFNALHDPNRHKEICSRLLGFLTERFSELDNLSIAVQHRAHFLDEKINQEAAELAAKYAGAKCRYRNMDGRLIYTGNNVFFMKKWARSCGYKVSPREILRISWELEAA